MSEWKQYSIEDFAEVKNTLRIPLSKLEREKRQGDFPYYGASGIIDYVDDYLFEGEHVLISEDGENLRSRKTPIAFKADGKFWVNNHAHVLKGKRAEFNDLLVYYFANLNINEFITGAVQPKLSKSNLLSIPIFLPEDEKVILEIVGIIKSLTDKIDLLHRQNQTLEQMAETLFRQWFMENPNPDWEERPMSSIATYLNGLACQKYPPKNEVDKLPVLKIKELRNGLSEDCDWCTTEVDEKYIVENGDVIFSWSASLMVKIWDGETCILNQHLFKVTSDEFPKWYFYLWSKFHLNQFIAIARAHATTMGHIKRGDLDEAMVLTPSEDEINEMSAHFEPVIEKITVNNRQISKLVALRDTLLPKLMSGEVKVSEL